MEINLLENKDAYIILKKAKNSRDFLMRLSALTDEKLVKGETLIFFDEVQECKEIVTAIKFLVEEGSFQYILSGSLLGVDLKDIKSLPVGYMGVLRMYPLDFEEFLQALGVNTNIISNLKECFEKEIPVDEFVNEKILSLYHLYLMIGGMPRVVQSYVENNNLNSVLTEQNTVLALYKKDIAKYDATNKLKIEDAFNLIPSELNSKNKRFVVKDISPKANFSLNAIYDTFLWLKESGVGLPTFCVDEPVVPLLLSKKKNLFKLFLSDIGLLAALYGKDSQLSLLKEELNINFGAIYENAVAQELQAHGYDLYYFCSKKQGELDFLIEEKGKVVPIEVKSGKDYHRHNALSNVMKNPDYQIEKAYVLYNGNLKVENLEGKLLIDDSKVKKSKRIVYMPIYMTMFLDKTQLGTDLIYKVDIDSLNKYVGA